MLAVVEVVGQDACESYKKSRMLSHDVASSLHLVLLQNPPIYANATVMLLHLNVPPSPCEELYNQSKDI